MRITRVHLRAITEGSAPTWMPLLDWAILAKPSDLEPVELRYLRRRAGWTAVEVARALGVSSAVTVSRWESRARRIPKPTERLLRLLVANALGVRTWGSLEQQFRSSWRQARAPLEIHLYPQRGRFEYRWGTPPKRLPKPMQRLFWDTSPQGLDLERHAAFIITRVLEKGDLEEWNWLRWTYGEARIAATLRQRRRVGPATARLWRSSTLAQPEGH